MVLYYSRLGPSSVSLMKAPKEPPSGLLWTSAGTRHSSSWQSSTQQPAGGVVLAMARLSAGIWHT
jgi:hypothetical protein